MNCLSCNATFPDDSKFCPFCGHRIANSIAASAKAAGQTDPGFGARASISREVTTRLPATRTIPRKYSEQLAAGVKPEAIIAELLERKDKIRALLEHTSKVIERIASRYPGEVRGDLAEGIKDYLRQHCKVCGMRKPPGRDGADDLCKDCLE